MKIRATRYVAPLGAFSRGYLRASRRLGEPSNISSLRSPWNRISRPQVQLPAIQLRPWITARTASTDSSNGAAKGPRDDHRRVWAIVAIAGFGAAFLYSQRPDPVRMDWGIKRKASASDPAPAPTSGKPVEEPGDTSTGRSLSLSAPGYVDAIHKMYEIPFGESLGVTDLPVEEAILTTAPNVPPPITRDHPALVKVPLVTTTKLAQLTSVYKYEQWTFNNSVPGPFIRARVGDVVELSLTNKDETGNPHNIDCHAFTGPGGGAALTTAEENETKTARFRLLYPGLFLYHCAAAPVPVHIANGMYGLIYVQPTEETLPKVDHEYYVMQSEFYHEPPEIEDDGRPSSVVEFSYPNALREEPNAIVFNGHEAALTRDSPLKAVAGETIRIFFGNAGPNLTSALHLIGSTFMRAYRDGDVLSPPSHFVQTVGVPPGDTLIADMKMVVPGTYTLLDHAIFRLDKGAVGYVNVSGKPRPDIYQSTEPPAPCVGCKLHP